MRSDRGDNDAYGTCTTSADSTAGFFRFSSKYTDQETGLVYYGYRYYSPGMGRWLNRDPIGEWGGLNLFVALLNSPINTVDAYGKRISVTFGNEGDDLQVVTVSATVQIIDCPTPPRKDEDDSFRKKIEGVWTVADYYREMVAIQVRPNSND